MSFYSPTGAIPEWAQPAVALGHDLYEDGIRCERWTCRNCGGAVLQPQGLVYGSAIEKPCEGSKTIPCAQCAEPTDPLAVFPRGLCLDCHKRTPEARRPLTAAEVRSMWGFR